MSLRIPRPLGRRWGLLAVGASLVSCVLTADDTEITGTQPAQWRVVWHEDPSHSAILAWSTREPGKNHQVRFRPRGVVPSVPWHTQSAFRSGAYSYQKSESPTLYYHYVRLRELQPRTAYEVQMESDGHRSPVLYFVTAPTGEEPFSLLFGGDSRSDREMRRSVNRMIAELVDTAQQARDSADEIIGFMHGGDYIARGTSFEQWSAWLSDHELTVTADGRLLPMIVARGNHDRGRLFCEAFGFEVLDNHNWYGLSMGRQLRIVTLNTEASIAGDQAKWLETELATARPNHHWLVAQYHRPAFPAVKWPSSAVIHWVPLFERYNVDLVCEADGHNIKRTVPIRDGGFAEDGIVYIGEGGLGVPQRKPKAGRWYLQEPGLSDSGHHVHRLRFASDALTVETIRLGGERTDTYQRRPR